MATLNPSKLLLRVFMNNKAAAAAAWSPCSVARRSIKDSATILPPTIETGQMWYTPTNKSIDFPTVRREGRSPEIIYSHALGCKWDMVLPMKLEQVVGKMGFGFTRFEYKYFNETNKLWDIQNWIDNLLTLVDRGTAGEKYIIFACSASAVAALQAAIQRPERVESLILMSPGVGIELDYMDRVKPGSVKKLNANETVVHPSVGDLPEEIYPNKGQLVNHEKLMKYRSLDPVHHYDDIPIECPVRIVHGIRDFLVPYQNSLLLADKLTKSRKVEVLLLEKEYHIIHWISEMEMILQRALTNPQQNSDHSFALQKSQRQQQEIDFGTGDHSIRAAESIISTSQNSFLFPSANRSFHQDKASLMTRIANLQKIREEQKVTEAKRDKVRQEEKQLEDLIVF